MCKMNLHNLSPEQVKKMKEKVRHIAEEVVRRMEKDIERLGDENGKTSVKPPLGVKPRWLWAQERKYDLMHAIEGRLLKGEFKIPVEWVEEYNELIEKEGAQ
ncbi:hypothetical protein P4637_03305 [Halalkalibacterium halodurans]|uniref:hypothetical protein n=1 Tax=Halalkalibacterium halodurans TaxID=86665 RepID=UPI002E206879|nr:hypothetical protein [Halalkalibacterium halodurans]MED4105526.1 hypothetical protein [Halalkalibacterium halodurans]MED4109268.1 hypothetical protein [Halalkalibacterium halodurans]MED4149718.1 hypothetical protein [Halalkalibacterium halodurans]